MHNIAFEGLGLPIADRDGELAGEAVKAVGGTQDGRKSPDPGGYSPRIPLHIDWLREEAGDQTAQVDLRGSGEVLAARGQWEHLGGRGGCCEEGGEKEKWCKHALDTAGMAGTERGKLVLE